MRLHYPYIHAILIILKRNQPFLFQEYKKSMFPAQNAGLRIFFHHILKLGTCAIVTRNQHSQAHLRGINKSSKNVSVGKSWQHSSLNAPAIFCLGSRWLSERRRTSLTTIMEVFLICQKQTRESAYTPRILLKAR